MVKKLKLYDIVLQEHKTFHHLIKYEIIYNVHAIVHKQELDLILYEIIINYEVMRVLKDNTIQLCNNSTVLRHNFKEKERKKRNHTSNNTTTTRTSTTKKQGQRMILILIPDNTAPNAHYMLFINGKN